jgi:hypothetical protein
MSLDGLGASTDTYRYQQYTKSCLYYLIVLSL